MGHFWVADGKKWAKKLERTISNKPNGVPIVNSLCVGYNMSFD